MKDFGKMINSKDLENRNGLMELIMKDNFKMEKDKDKVK